MASFTAFTPTDPDAPAGGRTAPPRGGTLRDGTGSTTTIYYRAANGSRGSTTDASAVPSDAVVERRVTT